MYILNQTQSVIHDAEYIERFHLVQKPDAVLIIASLRHEQQPDTLGRYADMTEARAVLLSLFIALQGSGTGFEMPPSVRNMGERTINDHRTKRRGGS